LLQDLVLPGGTGCDLARAGENIDVRATSGTHTTGVLMRRRYHRQPAWCVVRSG